MSFFQRLFGRKETGAPANDDYVERRSGLVFPGKLSGLKRLSAGRPYAEGDRAGESIPYGTDTTQATIYVTAVANANFPDGGDNDFIRTELESAAGAARELERRGQYQSVKFFTADPQALGTTPGNLIWVRSAFYCTANGRPMVSFTYITALHGLVIKLRISSPLPDDKGLNEFPAALGNLISRQRSQS